MTRAIVCGGRDYGEAGAVGVDAAERDRRAIFVALDKLAPTEIAQGGCRTGADRWAREWAKSRGVTCQGYPAAWIKHGGKAGPIRNQRMFDDFRPDVTVATRGGRGTASMVRITQAGGVPVMHVGKTITKEEK